MLCVVFILHRDAVDSRSVIGLLDEKGTNRYPQQLDVKRQAALLEESQPASRTHTPNNMCNEQHAPDDFETQLTAFFRFRLFSREGCGFYGRLRFLSPRMLDRRAASISPQR